MFICSDIWHFILLHFVQKIALVMIERTLSQIAEEGTKPIQDGSTILYIKFTMSVCLSVCLGSFQALPELFLFFLMGFVFCVS